MTGGRILIIEDEENIRHTMQVALESEGYDVETAIDGPDGLLHFREPGKWLSPQTVHTRRAAGRRAADAGDPILMGRIE
jgi:DNA-binding response OmpR family regulator